MCLQIDIMSEQEADAASTAPEVSLLCDEQLDLSDAEPVAPPRGTEQLSAELAAREHYIKTSLGVETLPAYKHVDVRFKRQWQPVQSRYPYVARHAAEIIVASENTWYYPPKHLDSLLRRHSDNVVPTQAWLNMMKSVDVKHIMSAEQNKAKTQVSPQKNKSPYLN